MNAAGAFSSPDAGQDAADMNTLAAFLACPDILALTPAAVSAHLGTAKADLLVLVGNAVLHTIDGAAAAFRQGVAKDVMLAGGRGHSTPFLQAAIKADPRYEGGEADVETEAEMMRDLFTRWHGIRMDNALIEMRSTNCGANAVEALGLVREHGLYPDHVLLFQDPTMLRRTLASFRHAWASHPGVRFYGCPTFVPRVRAAGTHIVFCKPQIAGLWSMDRFLELILGEIPRLRDDKNGYGPRGRGYIEHVDVPADVEAAHGRLGRRYTHRVRSMTA